MSRYTGKITPTAILMITVTMMLAFVTNHARAQNASSAHKFNPYLADCYRNVTYLGRVGHHFSITLPHTKTCSVDAKHLPPGLSLKGCDVEGTPTAPGLWTFDVLLEAKCQGTNFGEVKVPINIRIDGAR